MKKLWGGRFTEELADDAKEYSYSLAVDGELLAADIRVSTAHAKMLAKAGLITRQESARLVGGLESVLKELSKADLAALAQEYEDVHTLIQVTLEKKIGKTAKKLHTGRSRNDLVVTSVKVYLREKIALIRAGIVELQKALVFLGEKFSGVAIPGYTHLQRAQTVLLAHHLLAYVEMLERDGKRFAQAADNMNECPLGAAALAGSSLPIDRAATARELGFARPTANSIDSVSDRDFLVETLADIAILFMHLSRLSEDMILWNTSEFGFINFPDSYATGSSLMPHKKNPDMLELTRGRAGAAIGNLVALLVTMKGLPLAYNRDMQEDKKALFESVRQAIRSLGVLSHLVRKTEVNEELCYQATTDSLLYATDLLDYLILKGTAFEDAHALVGRMVQHSLTIERPLKELSFSELRQFSPKIEKDIYQVFNPAKSLAGKKTIGSTQPALVAKQLKFWKHKTAKKR
ncbi:MAG: argininosuccinate lyase [Candidatus Omnitrophica bacterium]|nr:argininosuccinate lyase [Candidatus Omnitrophota bacterium]